MKRYKVHMIANAHIDPAWMWHWEEGFAEILATFRSALDRLNETPELTFTASSAAYYAWVERVAPEMFEEIKRRVQEGRWIIVGGWWVEPDCNLPSGESFARHALYSQRYYLEKFGITSKIGFNVDSFGHSSALPQLLLKGGMNGYVFQRPGSHENSDIPVVFIWEGTGGSRVPAYKLVKGYATRIKPCIGLSSVENVDDKLRDMRGIVEEIGTDAMCLFGVGNHGGGPTKQSIRRIEEWRKGDYPYEISYSSPDRYFDDMKRHAGELPIFSGDLLHHAAGAYTSVSHLKKNNRLTEHKLIRAEKFAAAAHALFGGDYPAGEIRKAWESVLFNQFHDIMAGCSIKTVCDEADRFYGYSLKAASGVLNESLQKISWNIDTMPAGSGVTSLGSLESKLGDSHYWDLENLGAPLVLFNSLSWDVSMPIVVNTHVSSIIDNAGNPVQLQKVLGPRCHFVAHDDTVFMAQIPACGYTTYRIFKDKQVSVEKSNDLSAGRWFLKNESLHVDFDEQTGTIRRFEIAGQNLNLLEGAAGPLIIDDKGDSWGHQVDSYRDVCGVMEPFFIRLMESGPVRAVIRIKYRYNTSTMRQDFILYKGSDRLVVEVRVDWHEEDRMLKLAFPTTLVSPVPEYELPYAFAKRKANGEEMPGQSMLDLTGRINDLLCGVTLVNDAKYAYDVQDAEMRLSVLRSPAYNSHFKRVKEEHEDFEYMDQGIQTFIYALIPHSGERTYRQVRAAYELNNPPEIIFETYHRGDLPTKQSFIYIDSGNVICSAFKRSEDGCGYILRLFENQNMRTEATIDIPLLDVSMQQEFEPGEIKTIRITDEKTVRDADFTEMPDELLRGEQGIT